MSFPLAADLPPEGGSYKWGDIATVRRPKAAATKITKATKTTKAKFVFFLIFVSFVDLVAAAVGPSQRKLRRPIPN